MKHMIFFCDFVLQIDSYIDVNTVNDIGPEGAKVLGEALKHNIALISLFLEGMKSLLFCGFFCDPYSLLHLCGLRK